MGRTELGDMRNLRGVIISESPLQTPDIFSRGTDSEISGKSRIFQAPPKELLEKCVFSSSLEVLSMWGMRKCCLCVLPVPYFLRILRAVPALLGNVNVVCM